VQQASAAAASLEEQANRLEQAVAVFKLLGMQGSSHPTLSAASTATNAMPAPRVDQQQVSRPVAKRSDHEEWEEF